MRWYRTGPEYDLMQVEFLSKLGGWYMIWPRQDCVPSPLPDYLPAGESEVDYVEYRYIQSVGQISPGDFFG